VGRASLNKKKRKREGGKGKRKEEKRREEGSVIILDIYFGYGEWRVDPQSLAT
jgi:hypothetical protein